jgi:hypothetical protein
MYILIRINTKRVMHCVTQFDLERLYDYLMNHKKTIAGWCNELFPSKKCS